MYVRTYVRTYVCMYVCMFVCSVDITSKMLFMYSNCGNTHTHICMGFQVLLPAYWWPARQLVQLDFRSLGFGRLSSIERNETAAGKMEYEYLQVMRRRSGQLYLEVLSMAAITPLGFDFR